MILSATGFCCCRLFVLPLCDEDVRLISRDETNVTQRSLAHLEGIEEYSSHEQRPTKDAVYANARSIYISFHNAMVFFPRTQMQEQTNTLPSDVRFSLHPAAVIHRRTVACSRAAINDAARD